MKWRLLDTGYAHGHWNMAVDEAILIHHSRGETPPTIRFYAWDPPAVSIGYFQDAHKEINVKACRDAGIFLVRRITGGRAILHDKEVTYSLVAADDNSCVKGTVLQSYLKISKCLLRGLEELGIAAKLSSSDRKKKKTAACFDSPSWYELVVDNRKLIGSAQTRRYGCILQHGSIPLEMDVDKLFSVLKVSDEKLKIILKRNFAKKAISLQEAGKKIYSYAEVVGALVKGFAETFDIELQEGKLTAREEKTAGELAQEKYGNDNWNLKTELTHDFKYPG